MNYKEILEQNVFLKKWNESLSLNKALDEETAFAIFDAETGPVYSEVVEGEGENAPEFEELLSSTDMGVEFGDLISHLHIHPTIYSSRKNGPNPYIFPSENDLIALNAFTIGNVQDTIPYMMIGGLRNPDTLESGLLIIEPKFSLDNTELGELIEIVRGAYMLIRKEATKQTDFHKGNKMVAELINSYGLHDVNTAKYDGAKFQEF